MKYERIDDKVIELDTMLEDLHEARVELARISGDPREAENYRLRQNAMSERMNALLEAEAKGIAKGIISDITGLSVEEINELK